MLTTLPSRTPTSPRLRVLVTPSTLIGGFEAIHSFQEGSQVLWQDKAKKEKKTESAFFAADKEKTGLGTQFPDTLQHTSRRFFSLQECGVEVPHPRRRPTRRSWTSPWSRA